MVWTDLVGRSNHGSVRLPTLIKRMQAGVLKCPCRPRFEASAPNMQLLDGDEGFGQYVGEIGMGKAIELAREDGAGAVGVHNSNFFGTGAYFVHQAARAGMVSLVTSNSVPNVAAHGGHKMVLGTNPFAFGAPRRNGRSLMGDMATSALAGSTIRDQIRKGLPLAEGLAIDEEGNPVTDPEKAKSSALLPIGGAKGYVLGLLGEIMSGVITGSGVSHGVASMYKDFTASGNNGHFFLALDISRWMPLEAFYDRLESLVQILKASAPEGEVLLPGERRWRAHDFNSANGILVEAPLRDALSELSTPLGIPPPWA
jgi:LDH2 family malate/lactate/ureidoglycolate dehydrogenase